MTDYFEQAVRRRRGNKDNPVAGLAQPKFDDLPNAPADVYYNLFRGGGTSSSIEDRAKSMGFTFSGPRGSEVITRDGESFKYLPNSLKSDVVSQARPAAQALGGMAGFAVNRTPLGGALGGILGGQLLDAVMGFAEPKGTSLKDEAEIAFTDMSAETLGVGVGKLLSASPQAVGWIKDKMVSTGQWAVNKVSPAVHPMEEALTNIYGMINKKPKEFLKMLDLDVDLRNTAGGMGIPTSLEMVTKNPQAREALAGLRAKGVFMTESEQASYKGLAGAIDDSLGEIAAYRDITKLGSDFISRTKSIVDKAEAVGIKHFQGLKDYVTKNDLNRKMLDPETIYTRLREEASEAGDIASVSDWAKTLAGKLGGEFKASRHTGAMVGDTVEFVPSPHVDYHKLDGIRKEVGRGYQKINQKNAFSDVDQDNLDLMYALISTDQQAFATKNGFGRMYEISNKLIHKRNLLEDKMVNVFGKGLIESSVGSKAVKAGAALRKGNVSKFDVLMNDVPKYMRRPAAKAALAGMINTSVISRKNKLGKGFLNAMDSLKANKGSWDRLFAEIGPDAANRMDTMVRVTKELFDVTQSTKNQSFAKSILDDMDAEMGWVNKMWNKGKRAGVYIAVMTQLKAPIAAWSITDAVVLNASSFSRKADRLMSHPDFMKDAIAYAETGKSKIMDTDAGKAWLSEQTKANIDLIQTYGFWPYLFQSNPPDVTPKRQQANAPIQTVSGPVRDPAEVMASMLDRKNQ